VSSANVEVRPGAAPATNLRVTGGSGNTFTLSWDAPTEGPTITGWRIEATTNAAFAGFGFQNVGPITSVQGTLASGTWYVRLVGASIYGSEGAKSDVLCFTLPGGASCGAPPQADPPGAPVFPAPAISGLTAHLSWSAGPGGTPTSYTVHVGSSPSASDLAVFPMGAATTLSGQAAPGTYYARVVAANSAGQAVSDEHVFTLGGGSGPPVPPGTPSMNAATVSGGNVTLSWNAPGSGGTASTYTVIARIGAMVVATLPGQAGTTAFVPNAPPGTYLVTVVAVNSSGTSAESNQVVVSVP
jgi:hypothetical protein